MSCKGNCYNNASVEMFVEAINKDLMGGKAG
jgi:hypothetical protein